MQVTIHRGIDQVGGCIAEVASSSGARIIIDLGLSLPSNDPADCGDELNSKEAIEALTAGVDAIFYTHYHGDHVGLMEHVPSGVEQWIGEVAKEVVRIKGKYLRQDLSKIEQLRTFRALQRIEVKDMTITPFFVSHSAADSYMFLIESGGKKVLHTGDFRDHGYTGKGLAQFVPKYIGQVDVLITEGTMLSRQSEAVKSERELQLQLKKLMQQYKYVYAVVSSTDMDRLASYHKANLAVDNGERMFVCDQYQSEILDAFTASSGSITDLYKFDNISVFPRKKLLEEMLEKGFCMLVRPNGYKGKYQDFCGLAARKTPADSTVAVYSMWAGYLTVQKCKNQNHIDFLARFKNTENIHTSGHATHECLAQLCTMTNPKQAITPIHSENSAAFDQLPISAELKSKIFTDQIFKLK